MRRALLGATAVASLLLTAAPASADGPEVQVLDLGSAPSGSLRALTVDGLVPGSTSVARFRVHRHGLAQLGLLASAVLDVRDLEGGCVRPEAAAGDTTCGASEGELSSQLDVAVGWSLAGDCSTAALPAVGARLHAQAAGEPQLAGLAAGDDDACVVVRVDLPWEADNTTQSDAAVFDLRLGVLPGAVPAVPGLPGAPDLPTAPDTPVTAGSGAPGTAPLPDGPGVDPSSPPATGTADGAGVAEGGGGPGAGTVTEPGALPVAVVPRPSLPLTGLPLVDLLATALALAGVGSVLLRAGRRR